MSQLTPVSNLLVTLNSSVNFIIYCIFGEKFKRLFCQLFCGRKWCCFAALANKDDFPLLQGRLFSDGRRRVRSRHLSGYCVHLVEKLDTLGIA